jgi:hypothetical protein
MRLAFGLETFCLKGASQITGWNHQPRKYPIDEFYPLRADSLPRKDTGMQRFYGGRRET